MAAFETAAHAKINLTLDVRDRQASGYHDLCMLMQTVTLSDPITIEENGTDSTQVLTNLKYLPRDDRNLAAAAAAAFWRETGTKPRGLTITIRKQIPVCAGMAGGSADGAAVLRALNRMYSTGLSRMELARIGEAVGSDVPYCVCEGTMLAEGRGERLTALPRFPPVSSSSANRTFRFPPPNSSPASTAQKSAAARTRRARWNRSGTGTSAASRGGFSTCSNRCFLPASPSRSRRSNRV